MVLINDSGKFGIVIDILILEIIYFVFDIFEFNLKININKTSMNNGKYIYKNIY